jgi:predicted sulfurtransferase
VKILYKKGSHVIIHFPAHEFKQALSVLKAMAQFFGASFIFDAAKELEEDLTPRLVYRTKFHLCPKCCMELHEDEANSIKVNESWQHAKCKELKTKRPN